MKRRKNGNFQRENLCGASWGWPGETSAMKIGGGWVRDGGTAVKWGRRWMGTGGEFQNHGSMETESVMSQSWNLIDPDNLRIPDVPVMESHGKENP